MWRRFNLPRTMKTCAGWCFFLTLSLCLFSCKDDFVADMNASSGAMHKPPVLSNSAVYDQGVRPPRIKSAAFYGTDLAWLAPLKADICYLQKMVAQIGARCPQQNFAVIVA